MKELLRMSVRTFGALLFVSGGVIGVSSGVSGASTGASPELISTCGSLSFVTVCGSPQYISDQLATDEINYVENAYYWTVPEQASIFSNMVNDLNTVAGFGAGLPPSEQAQIESDLSTTKYYFDLIKDNLIINDPLYDTNSVAYALVNGLCVSFPGLCLPAF